VCIDDVGRGGGKKKGERETESKRERERATVCVEDGKESSEKKVAGLIYDTYVCVCVCFSFCVRWTQRRRHYPTHHSYTQLPHPASPVL